MYYIMEVGIYYLLAIIPQAFLLCLYDLFHDGFTGMVHIFFGAIFGSYLAVAARPRFAAEPLACCQRQIIQKRAP